MRFFCVVIFLVAPQGIVACPLGDQPNLTKIKSPQYELSYVVVPSKIVVGRHFKIKITVCDGNGKPFGGTILTDAVMPAHGHGMNYNPTVNTLAAGKFLSEGYLLHMPGMWQFIFDLRSNGRSQRLVSDFKLE